MENGLNNRNELYKIAPENIRELYAGEETGELLWNTASRLGIKGGITYKTFALAVGDIILGLYKKESLELLLQQKLNMTPEQTKWVHQELQPLLNKIPDEAIGGEAPTVLLTPPPELSTQPTLTPVKPMRTFPDDFNAGRAHSYGAFRPEGDDSDPDEPTHTTNQDDVLRK